MSETVKDGAMIYRPKWQERIWRRLGYRYHLNDLPENADRLPGWMMTKSKIHFSLGDRIRLIFTGRLYLETRTATDTVVSTAISSLSFQIGRPGDHRGGA